MHIEFLLEEPSAEAALYKLVPKIIRGQATFATHVMGGKTSMLKELPRRLRGYAQWLPRDWRLIVLVDRDDDDCRELKERLEAISREAGLLSKSSTDIRDRVQVVNRLAVEELEAWFFGDPTALRTAYPRLPDISRRARFRDPDGIDGGTCESLERLLQKAGYYRGGLPKIELARSVAQHMEPARNGSRSFRVFCDALRELVH